jgi:hypothetical protein
MKRTIIAFIAGLLLATAGTAGAVTTAGYWQKSGSTYACSGISNGASCNLKGSSFKVYVLPNRTVSVSYGSKPLFICHQYDTPYDCVDLSD